jgi:hypothetical protein
VPHWLGDDPAISPAPNPIRRATPEHGYFIARHLLSADHVRALTQLSVPVVSPGVALGAYDDVRRWCGILAQETGANVMLPTADEWEMAARGPDGRRVPWGNGLERDARKIRNSASPWGVRDTVGIAMQWTRSESARGMPIACGMPGTLRVAARCEADGPGELGAVRLAVY